MSKAAAGSVQPRRIVAVIPARGGSKSIPRKNIVPLGGKPLLAWSIEAARAVPAIARTIVSTDDEEIAAVAKQWGAEVIIRPADLATDTAIVIDALRDLIQRLRAQAWPPEIVVLLEPTCPLRRPTDIEACLADLDDEEVDSVASFKPAELNPWRAWRIENRQPQTFLPEVDPWSPRQALPPAYQLNGAVYAFRADRLPDDQNSLLFGRAAATVMPPERSIDIDGPLDLLLAEAMLGREKAR